MAAQQLIQPQIYVGTQYAGYKYFVYDVGTTTKQTIWTDSTQGTTQSNPATVDANGFINIFVNGNFKVVLAAAEVAGAPSGTVWTQDECLQDPDGISIAAQTSVTVATGDLVLIEDISNSNAKGQTTAGDIANLAATDLVNDTSPQLGADLDANAFDIQFDDATGIRDDSDNEQLIFQKTASAVNHIEITNAATAGTPKISAAGDDANIDLELAPKGTGEISVTGGSIKLADAEGLKDSNGNEQLVLQETASAVNEFEITNAATGNNPQLAVTGDDTNIGLDLLVKGNAAYTLKGTADTAAELRLNEDTDNGTNYLGFKAPAAVTTSTTWTLPDGDGTADQIIKTNGSGTLAWTDAGSGAWKFLGSVTASASSALDFEDGVSSIVFDGTYALYKFVIVGLYPSVDANINIRVKSGGAFVSASEYYTQMSGQTTSAAFSHNGQTTNDVIPASRSSTDGSSGAGLSGIVYVGDPTQTGYKKIWLNTQHEQNANLGEMSVGGGYWRGGTGDLQGIRFLPSTGTLTAGTIYMYGSAKS